MAAKPLPTPTQLLKLFQFNSETGEIFHRPRSALYFSPTGRGGSSGQAARWNGRWAGKLAGFISSSGYRQVNLPIIGGGHVSIGAHRIIWCLEYGEWPDDILDHINGVRDDNRPANLRKTTLRQNARNMALMSSNTSGHCGVSWDSGINKWFAQIIVDGNRKYLGSFNRKMDAVNARKAANIKYGFDDGHGKPKIIMYPARRKNKNPTAA